MPGEHAPRSQRRQPPDVGDADVTPGVRHGGGNKTHHFGEVQEPNGSWSPSSVADQRSCAASLGGGVTPPESARPVVAPSVAREPS